MFVRTERLVPRLLIIMLPQLQACVFFNVYTLLNNYISDFSKPTSAIISLGPGRILISIAGRGSQLSHQRCSNIAAPFESLGHNTRLCPGIHVCPCYGLFRGTMFAPVRTERLELSWVAPPAPKAGASTNFATSASKTNYIIFETCCPEILRRSIPDRSAYIHFLCLD